MLYLHIGLQKTGTTFLQKAVFPRWKGINYLPTDNLEKLLRIEDDEINLLSREGLSGKNWSSDTERRRNISNLAKHFPQARIILSFRRHSDFILSSYKQYLQRGGFEDFEHYFDIQSNQGFMKREDFLYRTKLETVLGCFEEAPFVILYSQIIEGLPQLLSNMEAFIGGSAPKVEDIPRKRYNKSVGYYPAILLRWLNRHASSELNPDGRYPLYHWRLKRLGIDPRSVCQYRLGFLPDKPMIPESIRREIDLYYTSDWDYIVRYAEQQGPGKALPLRQTGI